MAQQDFSDPKYAVWGDTPQEREQNILNSNFLKESLDNKDYNAAAHYLKELLDKCPKASQNTFVRGITLYKNKIARAKSIAEKNTYTDCATSISATIPSTARPISSTARPVSI